MSETDDRAAKAARAKAMLKKRQQKKVAGSATGIASPPASPSLRAFSPALSEVPIVSEEKSDLSDVFTNGDSDSNWLVSLPRVETPPSRPSSVAPGMPRSSTPAISSPLVSSPQPTYPTTVSWSSAQQVVAQLESEKAALLELQARYEALQSKVSESEKYLQESRNDTQTLKGRVQQLEADAQNANERIHQLTAKEGEMLAKSQGQIQDYEGHLHVLRNESQTLRSRVLTLENSAHAAQERILQLTAEGEESAGKAQAQIQNQQQTISLLVSEKASLMASLDRMEELESETREKETLLQEEVQKTQVLNATVKRLENELCEAADEYQEQERELQLTNGTLDDLRGKSDEYQRRVRELEEHIQSDDRAEKLEESLKNTQERADEFEFQLSKLKQSHGVLKTERDGIESQLRLRTDAQVELKHKHGALEAQHVESQTHLTSAISERDALHRAHALLQSQVTTNQAALLEVQQKLAAAASELVSNARQLQNAHSDLRAANRRADEAEKTQKDLQSEGSNLMRSLDEMRPKIVELTGDKVELGNKIDSLEHALRSRDATIADLENIVEEMRDEHGEASKEQDNIIVQREKEHSSVRASLMEMQKAYTDLQGELEDAQASLRSLEADRTDHYQVAARQSDEIERLMSSLRTQADEYSAIKHELAQRKRSDEEDQGFVERAQEEIESLHAELNAADEEIQQLRDAVSSPPSNGAPDSLDAEMLNALKQQHVLDLSAAQSRIRALETTVFEAQAQSHTLQKRVNLLENQLATSPRPDSRAGTSRPSSRAHSHPHQPGTLPPLSRSVFDIGLTPETRHKRQVSLSMLKARIDSELGAVSPPSRMSTPTLGKRKPSALSTVHEPRSQRPQLDDHIFWCGSCKGDLIIL